MKNKRIIAIAAAIATAATLSGCAANADYTDNGIDAGTTDVEMEETETPSVEEPATPEISEPEPPVTAEPKVQTVSYIKVNSDGVNIRSGAGTGYSSRGTAEKSTLYTYEGEANGWYKIRYRNKLAYISAKYCVIVGITSSGNRAIEAVISEGASLLGTPYVYGAVRLHDGYGNMNRGFTKNAFDCSSLMQYMFYEGAGKLIQVNTRTQIYQGSTVSKFDLKRGDLMFFTNASRKNNTGIERVGHVGIYLGDNWILHTASDYAKIEQLSSARWGYFIQGQRIL